MTYGFRSFHPKINDIDIIPEIISLPAIEDLVFPADIANKAAKDGKYYLQHASDFRVEMISTSLINDSYTRVLFNGSVDFAVGLSSESRYSPETIANCILSQQKIASQIIPGNLLTKAVQQLGLFFDDAYVNVTDLNARKYRESKSFVGFGDKRYPIDIGWMIYFGPDLVDIIGRAKFELVNDLVAEKIKFSNGGIYLKTVDEIYSVDNEKHRERENKIIETLGLRELQEKK